MNLPLIWPLVQFLVCATAISVAGYRLAVEGERIGLAWGLTGSRVGLAMLGFVVMNILLADTSGFSHLAVGGVGLFYRPESRVLRTVGWVSIALAAVYLLNTYIVFLYGA